MGEIIVGELSSRHCLPTNKEIWKERSPKNYHSTVQPRIEGWQLDTYNEINTGYEICLYQFAFLFHNVLVGVGVGVGVGGGTSGRSILLVWWPSCTFSLFRSSNVGAIGLTGLTQYPQATLDSPLETHLKSRNMWYEAKRVCWWCYCRRHEEENCWLVTKQPTKHLPSTSF